MFTYGIENIFPQDVFDKICQLAKEKNIEELNELIISSVCLSAFRGAFNPIMWLARNGEVPAVEFLLNHFKGDLNQAVEGYAMGGHIEEVRKLITRGADIEDALIGAIRGGYLKEIQPFIEDENVKKIISIVCGPIESDYVKKVRELSISISKISSNNSEVLNKNYFDILMYGYTLVGDHNRIRLLINADINKNSALKAYAKMGCDEKVNILLNLEANNTVALLGYAMGGFSWKVINLIPKKEDISIAISGFARGGHINALEKILINLDNEHENEECFKQFWDTALICLASEGHFGVLEKFIIMYREKWITRYQQTDKVQVWSLTLNGVMIGLIEGGYFNNRQRALRAFSFINDREIRHHLAKKLKRYLRNDTTINNPIPVNFLLTEVELNEILDEANHLNEIMRHPFMHDKKTLTYDDARYLLQVKKFKGAFAYLVVKKGAY